MLKRLSVLAAVTVATVGLGVAPASAATANTLTFNVQFVAGHPGDSVALDYSTNSPAPVQFSTTGPCAITAAGVVTFGYVKSFKACNIYAHQDAQGGYTAGDSFRVGWITR